jgi:hypothetical protein
VARSRVELFEQIRNDRRVEGASIRELADRHHVHRRTVRQALESAVPPPRRPYPPRPRPAIDVYAPVIDGWLQADREVPRKQRHTARRVWQRLVAEHGAASKYGFDSFFCIPGKDGAHEKGGVEGEIGRFRRRHLVPVPSVASLAALNQLIAAADMLDDGRVITGRPLTIAAAFAAEQPAMLALPAEIFDSARLLTARVDSRARICVRQNYYSVPARYAGRRLAVRLSATTVQALDGPQVIVGHERSAGKHAEVLVLDHYLDVLKYKPGALPGATALAQARAAGAFTLAHQRYWDAARHALGDSAGTNALIEVLLRHRALPAAVLCDAMDRAVHSAVLDPQAVLIDARRLAGRPVAAVIPIGALARYDRPAPALAGYDQLLSETTR